MLDGDVINASSAYEGENIFNRLSTLKKEVRLTVVNSGVQGADNDLDKLAATGANVHWLDVNRMLGQGAQHANLWTVDAMHAYLGSAHMDWRSLTQVKELGISFYNCPSLVGDLDKIIRSFIYLSGPNSTVPVVDWPAELITKYNRTSPMKLELNGIPSKVYITMSPPPFTPPGRNDDLDAILHIIEEARSFIYISVMDFAPMIRNHALFERDGFWPVLNNALCTAALTRKIEVRLLVSKWKHESPNLKNYMNSLRALHDVQKSNIRTRYFQVPVTTDEQKSIPFGRVNHNKYMVTDRTLYIGTSNWSGDYFKYAGGAAFVVNETATKRGGPNHNLSLREQLAQIFNRDWNSKFTLEL